MTIAEESLKKHYEWKGKLEVSTKIPLETFDDLSNAYTPGVARACTEIVNKPDAIYDLTWKNNCVAVITDGSAVLGLGNIGPQAGMPVMEGKCVLLKKFAGVDAIPICLNTQDTDEIVDTVYRISDSFGGINLEDISAPRCFEIEKRLNELCNIPVFHDDQHGTAIVVGAGLLNALKVLKKDISKVKIVVNGAGAAGIAISKHLVDLGAKNLILVDRVGILQKGMDVLTSAQEEMLEFANKENMSGTLADAMVGADVFIGVSAGNIVSKEMAMSMADENIIFAMANPTPEISYELAKEAGVTIIGTGRSDYPNQINNLLAFPGIFRGLLDSRAKKVTNKMKVYTSHAIANIVAEEDLSTVCIIPNPFDERIVPSVAGAVIRAFEEDK
ncbi:MAG: NADP-dependent malic enzyme [Bacillota bacterium]